MFNQRKNKSFHYKSRLSRETNPDPNLDMTSMSKDFVSKWKRDGHLNKRKVKGGRTILMLVLGLLLLLIFMYILDKRYM